ncbi:MAG: Hsp20/alpha crystallin family protein [Spirochaetota bacterium]
MNNDKIITSDKKKDVELSERDYSLPLADIREGEDNFYLELEMPGVEKNDVDINVENDVLTVESHRNLSDKACLKCITQEFLLQNYRRSFTLNNSVDVEKISASMENGILKLKMPKSEKLKPRKIKIETK